MSGFSENKSKWRPPTQQELLSELTESNDFFDMLVDMIPSKLYIAGQSRDDFDPTKTRYYKNSGEDSKDARKAAAKMAKRRKLDPSLVLTTVQSKILIEEQKMKEVEAHLVTPTAPDDDDDNDEKTKTNKMKKNEKGAKPISDGTKSRIEALREKLHAKIEQKRKESNRPAPDEISKRAARKNEKNRRREDRKKKKQGKSATTGATTSTSYKVNGDSAVPDPSVDLANVDFGRLAGLNNNKKSIVGENYLETNKALANLSKTKNLQKMLEEAQAKKEKLEALKQSDREEDRQKAKEMQWADTFREADGTRVKDDPAKLKKALLRKVAKKQKSQKAWQSRMEQQQEKKDERQKIRKHNLEARKQGGKIGANLSKKEIKDPDAEDAAGEGKGRRLNRAGFEGRKREFLNNPQGGASNGKAKGATNGNGKEKGAANGKVKGAANGKVKGQ